MTQPDVVASFEEECRAFGGVIAALGSDDFGRLTNCPPWTLHELVVHVIFSIRLPDSLPPQGGRSPEASAADYFRRPERDTVQYRSANVDRTQAAAASIASAETGRLFAVTAESTAKSARHVGADYVIDAAGRALRMDSYLRTRIISVAAHGVDVALTLGVEPWTTDAAHTAIRPVLVDLLGAEPPESWSNQDLLELGTGRRRLDANDLAELGPLAERFPLLS